MVLLEVMDEDVICIEDEDEEIVLSKIENKIGKRNLYFLFNFFTVFFFRIFYLFSICI